MHKLILITAWLTVICAAIGGTVCYLAYEAQNRQENVDYREVVALLSAKKTDEALDILKPYSKDLSVTPPQGLDWLPLFIEAYQQADNATELVALYLSYPRGFDSNEEATLKVAAALLSQKKVDDFYRLASSWQNRLTKEADWFVLDADALLVEGRINEALKLLQSRVFDGTEDSGRLIRLALIHAKDNLAESWNILGEALEKDPTNADVTTYRAQILEAIQKPTLARIEYLSAIQKDPRNPSLIYQLGEFYRRNGHYELALNAWSQGLDLPHSEELWLATLFWSKMTSPMKSQPAATPPKNSALSPLITYLHQLPADHFWNDVAFDALPEAATYLKTRQETFWLRLANALAQSDEAHAAELLDFNTFHNTSWSPQLQLALQQILAYRRYGILHIDEVSPPNQDNSLAEEDSATRSWPPHQLFRTLQTLAQKTPAGLPAQDVPLDIQALLNSRLAFPAAFLASGWLEAALTFPVPRVVPEDFPGWVSFAYTQAIRYGRSPLEALNFATRQTPNQPLTLLTGELMISTGSPDAGIEQLKPLTGNYNEIGVRAAWLISQVNLDRKDFQAAQDTVMQHPMLSRHVVGKETLARIALQQGDIAQADTLYGKIEKESLEARFYLARRALSEKKWDLARRLTEQLVIEYPDNQQLHRDLQRLRVLTEEGS